MAYRPQWLSEGYEDLIAALDARAGDPVDFDVVIVGSGYGGAVAAARLAGAKKADGSELSVCVLERGREYVPGTFPRRFSDLPGHVRFSRGDQPGAKGRRDGLFDFRIGNDVSALVGNGLGGGSLINASVAERAQDDVFGDPAWPAALRRDLNDPKDPNSLKACYARAEEMLEVRPAPADHYTKYREFEALGRRLGLPPARPATVARHFKDPARGQEGVQNDQEAVQNRQGVWQKPCIECGDCVTGCNVWAKNTLPMNYLARAYRAKAKLFTNVTVSGIARAGAGDCWKVWFCPTAEQHPPARPRAVRAAYVILAAGTFGSTEILMRSRSRKLRFSASLGKRFSTNGDMITVLYGQSDPVNAAPEETTPLGERHIGPTITGVIQTHGTRAERVLIEELAIPGALRRIFEEIITTGALPVQLGRIDWSRHGPQGADPAALDPEKIRRSQVFAAMGDDGAGGRLAMVEGWEKAESDAAICVEWPEAGKARVFERQDKVLARAQAGGRPELYLRNPLWMPLPENFTALLSGPKPSGKLFTVHPLGGCPMGDDAESGVVDDLGRVFDPPDKSDAQQRGNVARTHDGLLVLDGSIVPVALGINPLLTIAALAERAVARYAVLRDWTLDSQPQAPQLPDLPAGIRSPKDVRPPNPRPAQPVTAVRFAETMAHEWEFEPAPGEKKKRRKLELDVVFGDIRDIPKFLRTLPHEVEIASAKLKLLEDGETKASAALGGKVSWMERGKTCFSSRTIAVGLTWLRLRALADLFQRYREERQKDVETSPRSALMWLRNVRTFLRIVLRAVRDGGGAVAVCSNAGEVRYLRYDLELKEDFSEGAEGLKKGTRIEGLKTFEYAGGGNPWRQLSELAIRLPQTGIFGVNKLEIDFEAFFRRFAVQLQITEQRDQPSAIMDLASLALFMARIVFKTHFWSFRLPEYEKYDADRARRRLPGKLRGLVMRRHEVRVTGERGPLVLLLTHYWHGKRHGKRHRKQPVLLIHGFGASGAQFAHAGLKHNLVRHLAEFGGNEEVEGFDVWVAELRTSIALPSSYNQWTLDEVAKEDIPALVRFVLERTGAKELDVVAHCIGSAMFCTAVLAGKLQEKLQGETRNLVRSAVLLQVGPLITLSAGNRVRGYMAAALRRYMLTDHVDSSVDDRADWVNALIDRFLATYPYDEKEAQEHLLCPPCEPKTHIANCNRSAAVFGRLFQHENLDKKTLDLLGDLLGHTNLTTFEQTIHYAFVGRLTDYEACNSYVTEKNVREHFKFPVRFVHGDKNDVFDPDTTARSRKLLCDVFGKDAESDRKLIPNYGHLDPLIGVNARDDVFPCISGFLVKPIADIRCGARSDLRYPREPLIGPVLGWTREENGRWVARIWCRTDDEHSYAHFLIAVVLRADGTFFSEHAFCAPLRIGDTDYLGSVDLLGLIDVPLPEEPGDYRIVIAGAHSSTAANMPPPRGRPKKAAAVSLPSDPQKRKDYVRTLASPEKLARKPLDARYGRAIEDSFRAAKADRRDSLVARRTADPGYDLQPDSVWLPQSLLKRLDHGNEALDFAVASCRFAASRVDREQADRMFGRLRELLDPDPEDPSCPRDGGKPQARPSLLVLTGDQIYADATAGMFDPKSHRERFYDSYREAWTAPNAREVLRRLPTYMMMDDHETGDDWHPAEPDREGLREAGLVAFAEYQLAHSPRDVGPLCAPRSAAPGGARRAHEYSFDAGGFPFFVCDTRSEREGRARIMSREQFGALRAWLAGRQQDAKVGDRPKFVVSPSVVVPFLRETAGRSAYAARSDGWDGFSESLHELFSALSEEGVRNVVFLCGDPHISLAAEIWYAGPREETLHAACIVASPLYAPYPFANAHPMEFLPEGRFEDGRGATMRYRLKQFDSGDTHVGGDSFTLVSVRDGRRGWKVTASVHRAEGLPVCTTFEFPSVRAL